MMGNRPLGVQVCTISIAVIFLIGLAVVLTEVSAIAIDACGKQLRSLHSRTIGSGINVGGQSADIQCGPGGAVSPDFHKSWSRQTPEQQAAARRAWQQLVAERRALCEMQWEEREIASMEECMTFAQAEADALIADVPVTTVSEQDLQSLPIDPGAFTVQPDRDWVLINIETIAYSAARQQTINTTILGVPVRMRATPSSYTWDFGEVAPFSTTDPGAPWPDHSVYHVYRTPTFDGPARQINLTVTWGGEFSVSGGPWQQVQGTALTTQTSDPFRVQQARTALTTNDHPR